MYILTSFSSEIHCTFVGFLCYCMFLQEFTLRIRLSYSSSSHNDYYDDRGGINGRLYNSILQHKKWKQQNELFYVYSIFYWVIYCQLETCIISTIGYYGLFLSTQGLQINRFFFSFYTTKYQFSIITCYFLKKIIFCPLDSTVAHIHIFYINDNGMIVLVHYPFISVSFKTGQTPLFVSCLPLWTLDQLFFQIHIVNVFLSS